MAINNFNVTYPDFQLGQIIQPDELDVNFSDLTVRCNQLIDVVNQITDSVTDGGSGADTISLTPIAPFTSAKLQAFLEEVIAQLQSPTDGTSGADFIASTSISGVSGTTVQTQLESLKTLLDDLKVFVQNEDTRVESLLNSEVNNLQTQITSNDSDITTLQGKDADLQAQITSNDDDITSVRSRLTTNETDIGNLKTKDTNLQSQIDTLSSNTYTRSELYTNTEIEGLVKFNQAVDAETGVVTGREVFTIQHNMDDFPSVHVIGEKGYGHYGYAEGSYGIASDHFRLPCRVDYPDANKLIVSIDEHYEGTPTVTLNGTIATITFSDEQVTLKVYLRGNN